MLAHLGTATAVLTYLALMVVVAVETRNQRQEDHRVR